MKHQSSEEQNWGDTIDNLVDEYLRFDNIPDDLKSLFVQYKEKNDLTGFVRSLFKTIGEKTLKQEEYSFERSPKKPEDVILSKILGLYAFQHNGGYDQSFRDRVKELKKEVFLFSGSEKSEPSLSLTNIFLDFLFHDDGRTFFGADKKHLHLGTVLIKAYRFRGDIALLEEEKKFQESMGSLVDELTEAIEALKKIIIKTQSLAGNLEIPGAQNIIGQDILDKNAGSEGFLEALEPAKEKLQATDTAYNEIKEFLRALSEEVRNSLSNSDAYTNIKTALSVYWGDIEEEQENITPAQVGKFFLKIMDFPKIYTFIDQLKNTTPKEKLKELPGLCDNFNKAMGEFILELQKISGGLELPFPSGIPKLVAEMHRMPDSKSEALTEALKQRMNGGSDKKLAQALIELSDEDRGAYLKECQQIIGQYILDENGGLEGFLEKSEPCRRRFTQTQRAYKMLKEKFDTAIQEGRGTEVGNVSHYYGNVLGLYNLGFELLEEHLLQDKAVEAEQVGRLILVLNSLPKVYEAITKFKDNPPGILKHAIPTLCDNLIREINNFVGELQKISGGLELPYHERQLGMS